VATVNTNVDSELQRRNEALVLVFINNAGWRPRSPRSLVRIAAAADALNRDYLSEPEFMAAVEQLACRGFIAVTGTTIALTASGRTLLRGTKDRHWYRRVENIAAHLTSSPQTNEVPRGLLPTGAYTRAIEEYLVQHR
jgi:hypothetical protein